MHFNDVLLTNCTVRTATYILHTPLAHYSTHRRATTGNFLHTKVSDIEKWFQSNVFCIPHRMKYTRSLKSPCKHEEMFRFCFKSAAGPKNVGTILEWTRRAGRFRRRPTVKQEYVMRQAELASFVSFVHLGNITRSSFYGNIFCDGFECF